MSASNEDSKKAEPITNVIWLQRREQLVNEHQSALSKYLIARRAARNTES